MNKDNVAIAEAYYTAMGKKSITGMEKYLHPNVRFVAPLGKLEGKEAVLEAANKLMALFKTLTIRAKFGSGDQAMLAYDFDFPAPIGNCPTAVLMTFKDGLITKIELFFDGRPF